MGIFLLSSLPPLIAGPGILRFKKTFLVSYPFPDLPRAPLTGKTPPAGGGGTQVPKGEQLAKPFDFD